MTLALRLRLLAGDLMTVATIAGGLLWFTILPSIGVLYCLGWLR